MSKKEPSRAKPDEARESPKVEKKETRSAKPGSSKNDKHPVTRKPMEFEGTVGTWRGC